MSMAHSQNEIKGKSLVELAEQLEAEIREAVREGKSLYVMEKDIFGRALQIGHAAIEQVLALQGDGDLGQSVVTKNGRRLERSEEPAQRPLRTVFGEHTLWAYVYAARAHQAIELRPIDARLSLPPGRCSYFFEEFRNISAWTRLSGKRRRDWRRCCGKRFLWTHWNASIGEWESRPRGSLIGCPRLQPKKKANCWFSRPTARACRWSRRMRSVCRPSTRPSGRAIAAWRPWRRCIRSSHAL